MEEEEKQTLEQFEKEVSDLSEIIYKALYSDKMDEVINIEAKTEDQYDSSYTDASYLIAEKILAEGLIFKRP